MKPRWYLVGRLCNETVTHYDLVSHQFLVGVISSEYNVFDVIGPRDAADTVKGYRLVPLSLTYRRSVCWYAQWWMSSLPQTVM